MYMYQSLVFLKILYISLVEKHGQKFCWHAFSILNLILAIEACRNIKVSIFILEQEYSPFVHKFIFVI